MTGQQGLDLVADATEDVRQVMCKYFPEDFTFGDVDDTADALTLLRLKLACSCLLKGYALIRKAHTLAKEMPFWMETWKPPMN